MPSPRYSALIAAADAVRDRLKEADLMASRAGVAIDAALAAALTAEFWDCIE